MTQSPKDRDHFLTRRLFRGVIKGYRTRRFLQMHTQTTRNDATSKKNQ